jgi:restriction endonuclease
METGTGKTYVYLRTIFELNKLYGFSKFVIVVPSVAIKEGVYHTLKTAADHLKGLYAGVPFDYFLYRRIAQCRSGGRPRTKGVQFKNQTARDRSTVGQG